MNLNAAQQAAVSAAQAAGALMRRNLLRPKKINLATAHDIKLELDVRCQQLIGRRLRSGFREVSLLGEEGMSGNSRSEYRWVVDPIDGTVNYTCGIPHACVSIALQRAAGRAAGADYEDGYNTMIGVVHDPFCNETWTAIRGRPARLNGKIIHASRRQSLGDAIVSIGFAKKHADLKRALPYFLWLARRVRKIRMMGAAALGLTYVATGRFDAYIERGINLWDICAGGLIIQCAGGEFWHEFVHDRGKFRLVASSGALRPALPRPK